MCAVRQSSHFVIGSCGSSIIEGVDVANLLLAVLPSKLCVRIPIGNFCDCLCHGLGRQGQRRLVRQLERRQGGEEWWQRERAEQRRWQLQCVEGVGLDYGTYLCVYMYPPITRDLCKNENMRKPAR